MSFAQENRLCLSVVLVNRRGEGVICRRIARRSGIFSGGIVARKASMKFQVIHTNITVADLEKSVAFYEKALGFRVVRRVDGTNGTFRLAFLEIEEGGHRLELTWHKDRDPYRPGSNEERPGFISHAGFAPDDFDAALAYHKEMGVVCLESPKRGVYFIKDPDDHWMEVLPMNRVSGTPELKPDAK
jgi:lactoylglutathione lyase